MEEFPDLVMEGVEGLSQIMQPKSNEVHHPIHLTVIPPENETELEEAVQHFIEVVAALSGEWLHMIECDELAELHTTGALWDMVYFGSEESLLEEVKTPHRGLNS